MDEGNLIFGITTAINMTSKQDLPCIQQLVKHLLQRAEKNSSDTLSKMRELLSDTKKPIGIIINERFINIPPQIAVPLLENLQSEINRAVTKKMPYKFTNLLMILKFYRKQSKKNKPAEDIYTNQEEEIIIDEAIVNFEYSVQDEKDSGLGGDWMEDDPTLIPYRRIIIFEAKKLDSIIANIKQFIN